MYSYYCNYLVVFISFEFFSLWYIWMLVFCGVWRSLSVDSDTLQSLCSVRYRILPWLAQLNVISVLVCLCVRNCSSPDKQTYVPCCLALSLATFSRSFSTRWPVPLSPTNVIRDRSHHRPAGPRYCGGTPSCWRAPGCLWFYTVCPLAKLNTCKKPARAH